MGTGAIAQSTSLASLAKHHRAHQAVSWDLQSVLNSLAQGVASGLSANVWADGDNPATVSYTQQRLPKDVDSEEADQGQADRPRLWARPLLGIILCTSQQEL